jgi:hypothetical protein
MGTCKKTSNGNQSAVKLPKPGIITPVNGSENRSFQNRSAFAIPGSQSHLPNIPPVPDPGLDDIDRVVSLEQEIEHEFHEGFVTQVYNYLSLGYPSLARNFDDELSKITHIPIEELRREDQLVDAKGYVGAPEGSGVNEDGVTGGKCMRWTALRLYIQEWARQQSK